jgi:probable HAF family extracellular repeat protein
MKCRLQSFILSLTSAFVLTFFLLSTAFAQASYTVIDLGTLGGTYSAGLGINAYAEVTGTASTTRDAAGHVFLFSDGTMTDLGSLGGLSIGYAINASGEVTGYSMLDYSTSHAFIYSAGSMKDLGTLGSGNSAGAGINASGQVTGYSSNHAFLYSNGTMTDLGTLGGKFSGGAAINDSGQVTGGSTTAGDTTSHAFLYTAGTMTDLGDLGGSGSEGTGINAFGQVAGDFYTQNGLARDVFLYSGSTMSDLGTLSGGNSVAAVINNFDQIVGVSVLPDGQTRLALLYTPGAGIVDLNTVAPSGSGWTLTNAMGINDAGQITGVGFAPGGFEHAFLLSPVSVPISAFHAKLQITGKGETHFRLTGSFTLGTVSTGLDPLTQNVLLQLGSLPIPIQKGLFKQASNGEYVFQGVLGAAAVDFRIKPITNTSFEFRVQGRTATPFRVTNPARFILMIGNNKTMGRLPWR